jgi:DNA-binding transcriptional LysR family regulator
MTIDLNLLTALDALLAEGSVTGAGRRLGLSQSAVSRTLARLREATGDPLLVPAGRRMVPTPHAESLRERVRAAAEEARSLLSPQQSALDLARLARVFTLRANDAFVEVTAPRLIAAASVAPGVLLRFAPKPDKEVAPLRDGSIDLDIGVAEDWGAELRIQTLYRDFFVGVARADHPLLRGPITPEAFAACRQVSVSRRGRTGGPLDQALAALGIDRTIAAVVPSFPAALAIARETGLVTLLPNAFLSALPDGMVSFALPVATPELVISQLWHPRMDADPAHRWLRGLVLSVCKEAGIVRPRPAS